MIPVVVILSALVGLFFSLWIVALTRAKDHRLRHEADADFYRGEINALRDQRNEARVERNTAENRIEEMIEAIWGEEPIDRDADDVINFLREVCRRG